METRSGRFYITTAIDYPNSIPHMGHAYEKVIADFYARAARLRGIDTRFLIGLDEHGLKIQEAAEREGKDAQSFVDEKAKTFRELYALLEVSNDDFIRTSEARHHAFARDLYSRVKARGDIYQGVYEGDYCISCEKAYTKSELVDGKCPVHGTPPDILKEDSYFFRLGEYRDAVRTHIESHPDFISPAERRNEILARLREEVFDLSISRSKLEWGIPLPDDPTHVLYVWFDALSNYLSALKSPEDQTDRFWPADCHVIGKDIAWFHAVIWPAMLLSAGYPLPRQVYVHGFILDAEGRKMSKHLGNVVDPLAAVKEFSVDALRFYFLRAFASGQDGSFSLRELAERYESELGNDLGNLVLRVAKLIASRLDGQLTPAGTPPELDPSPTLRDFFARVDAREHHRAIDVLWTYIRRTNAYLNDKQPWKVEDRTALSAILGGAIEAIRVAAHLLSPAMPAAARSMAASLGFEIGAVSTLATPLGACRVHPGAPLFPRKEPEPRGTGAAAAPQGKAPSPREGPTPETAVDPFARLEIRVGHIDEAREHPDADSLFALTVDIGAEKRSICAGLRAHLSAEELGGRKVLVLANLKPAVLRGIESRGMVLAADRRDGKVVPVDPGNASIGELVTVADIPSSPKAKISTSDFKKAPLEVRGGQVTYQGKPLRTSAGFITCDAEDGSVVR